MLTELIYYLDTLLDQEGEGRHRAERVLELGGAVVSVLDWLDREDVRLLPLCCVNASAVGLCGYVDSTLPSRCYASPWIDNCMCVEFFGFPCNVFQQWYQSQVHA